MDLARFSARTPFASVDESGGGDGRRHEQALAVDRQQRLIVRTGDRQRGDHRVVVGQADAGHAVAGRALRVDGRRVDAPEGNLIRAEWLDSHRLPSAPPRPVKTVVGVDPSDSGQGDACGIVAASLGSVGTAVVLADVSAPLTSDAWANRAVELAITLGASETVPGRGPGRTVTVLGRGSGRSFNAH